MTVPAPIRWEDGKLWLLDQRLLPRQVVFEEQRDAESVARANRELRVRGAPAIGIAAAYGMALAQRCGTDLEQAARQLCAARPTAVNLGWAVSDCWTPTPDTVTCSTKRARFTTRIAPCAARSGVTVLC